MIPAACYADCITIRRSTGFSPFFLLHGIHPFLPCDLTDATFMVTEFKPGMTDEELLMARIRQLIRLPEDIEKARRILHKARLRSKEAFEAKYTRRLQNQEHQPEALVLLRNSVVENTMSIERKTTDRYMGPYRIVRRTKGGSYVLEEMNGNQLRHTVAAFRLIPYIKREDLNRLVSDQELGSMGESEAKSKLEYAGNINSDTESSAN